MSKKYSFEKIKNDIESIEGYKLLSTEYIKAREKLEITCPKNHKFNMSYIEFYTSGNRCPICAKENDLIRRQQRVSQYIKELNFELLSEYTRNSKRIKLKCHNEHIFNRTLTELKRGQLCPKCFKINREQDKFKRYKEYIESFKGYILLSNECTGCHDNNLIIKCPNNHISTTSFFLFKQRKDKCPICSGHHKYEYDYVKEYIENEGYKLLSTEYLNCDEKLLIECDRGHEFECGFYSFSKTGIRCPICTSNRISEQLRTPINKVYEFIKNNGYVFISWIDEYRNAHSKFKVKCIKCNCIWETTYDRLSRRDNDFCPNCHTSKGECKINNILTDLDIYFCPQFSIDGLVGVGGLPLRFDFAIFDDKEKTILKCLIEYDGIFHYEKQYDEDGFETVQEHDKRKNEYCKNNNIRLIRIPYWNYDNIEEILKTKVIIN